MQVANHVTHISLSITPFLPATSPFSSKVQISLFQACDTSYKMASLGNTSAAKPDKFSKENRWYYDKLDGFIDPSSRKLLEEYGQVPAEEVDAHIYKLVP